MVTTQSIMIQCVMSILLNGESVSPAPIFLKLGSRQQRHSPRVETEISCALRNPFLLFQLCGYGLRTRAVPLRGPLGLSGDAAAQTMSSAVSKTGEGM